MKHPAARPVSMVVAGGGTAGHIEPALAVADAISAIVPNARITALGTDKGLETTIVPDRGYDLRLIPPVPLPRKICMDLASIPSRLAHSVRSTQKVLEDVSADVVIGFGGYVALPAYFAARGRVRRRKRIPLLIHEANASAGLANKIGAHWADRILSSVDDCGLPDTEVVGIPVRGSISGLDRAEMHAKACHYFGLDESVRNILVFGGSQGAMRLNDAVVGAARQLRDAGIGVLHAYGPKNTISMERLEKAPSYVGVGYLKRMDLAYAAADLVICRSGAMTVAEVSAAGLPAIYVPLPHGNGEQALNALRVVEAGGGLLVPDEEMTSQWVAREVPALLYNDARLSEMAANASIGGHRDAAAKVARAALELARTD